MKARSLTKRFTVWGGLCGIVVAGAYAMGHMPKGNPLRFSGWVVYWQPDASIEGVNQYGRRLEEVSVFAADFDRDYQVVAAPWVRTAVDTIKDVSPNAPRRLITIVNDVRTATSSVVKSPQCVHDVISSPEKRAEHINQLVTLSEAAEGIEIDYEALSLADRDAYTDFIRELANQLHQRNKWLSVVVEAKTSDVLKDREGAIDWRGISQYADNVKVMAYLFHYPSGKPGPLAPPDWVANVARFALTQIPREKLAIALTVNAIDWPEEGPGKSMEYAQAAKILGRTHSTVERDRASASPFFEYTDRGVMHQVWFEDQVSLREKVKRLQSMGVERIALWHLGAGNNDYLNSLR